LNFNPDGATPVGSRAEHRADSVDSAARGARNFVPDRRRFRPRLAIAGAIVRGLDLNSKAAFQAAAEGGRHSHGGP